MSKKKWCGLLAILMAVSIVFTSGALRPVNVYAETIADLQEQSEEHQKKLEEINQQIEEAEANKADALEQKNLLDQQADILRSQISNAQQQIDALEAELADNQQKEESQYDLFCRQVRDEEERGTASFWSVIFKATSFSDLLGRIDFINEVAEHDQSVINDLRQLRQQMQADRQALEEQRSQLESRQTELDSQLEAATQLIAKYNETADGLNDLAAQEKAAADELSHPSCGDFLCKVIGKDVIGRCRAEISLFFYIREGAVGVVAPVRGGGILRRFIQCVEDLRGSHLNRGSVLFLGRLQAFLHEFLSFRHIISPVVHALHRGDHHVAGRFGSRNLIVPVVEKLFVGGAAGFRVGHPVRLIVVVKLRRNRVRRQLMFKFPCFHKESPSFQL